MSGYHDLHTEPKARWRILTRAAQWGLWRPTYAGGYHVTCFRVEPSLGFLEQTSNNDNPFIIVPKLREPTVYLVTTDNSSRNQWGKISLFHSGEKGRSPW